MSRSGPVLVLLSLIVGCPKKTDKSDQPTKTETNKPPDQHQDAPKLEKKPEPPAPRPIDAKEKVHPTDAAKKKLGGKSACAAKIDTSPSKASAHADWKALYDALADAYEKDIAKLDSRAKDETSAKQALCEQAGGCKGDGPF